MRISINLLPPEVVSQQFKKAKFYKIQTIGITIILTLAFLTSLTMALRVLQSRNISKVSAQVSQTEAQMTGLKSTQDALFLLNDRLKTIQQYWGTSSKQSAMYRLIDKLVPSSVIVNAVTVDKAGTVVFLALVPDSSSLDNLINNLTSTENNEGKIAQASIDSLNRGRDGLYRVSFKIKPTP